jgi:hypothetical protein
MRLSAIRSALRAPAPNPRHSSPICYTAPWRPEVIESGTLELILSQTVLEAPPALPALYAEMSRWLKPEGIVSHEIDFKSVGTTTE